MIKRYNQFVKENKTNEEFDYEMEAPVMPYQSDAKPAPITKPDTTERPAPTRPTPFPTTRPATEPGTKAEFQEEDEEVAVDKYSTALQKLADLAGVEFDASSKSVTINGKKVIFPTETEKYHVDGVKKPFPTAEEVIQYFESDSRAQSPERQEVKDEMTSLKDEEFLDSGEQFESKSYKNKRFKL